MPRSILVGLDGSSYSKSAVELGIRWARQFDALLVGMGIVDEPEIRHGEMVPIGGAVFKEHRDEVVLARARSQVEQFLEQFTLGCAEAGVASKVLKDVGPPGERIILEAQRYDLILLGRETHFHFATQEGPCETLKQVLKSAPRPVVAVPDTLGDGKSILIAYDGSLQAARALQAFQASGLTAAGNVHIVTVGDEDGVARRHAERAAEFLRLHDILAEMHVLKAPAVDQAILDQARLLDAQLLVMGAYGQSTLREFFLGSMTRTALNKSTVPLFLYH